MSKHIGISAFGYYESAYDLVKNSSNPTPTAYISDAVLPKSYNGRILVGEAAENERIASGLYWPPEASISPTKPLRRMPISSLWTIYNQTKDSRAYYRTDKHQFNISSILTQHIINLIEEQDLKHDKDDELIVTIPDSLDEYGQEELLRDFNKQGYRNVRLLWRSIAAALDWCQNNDNHDGIVRDSSWLLVVYIGLDGVELIPLDLTKESYNNNDYLVPIRRRDYIEVEFRGADLVGALAESSCGIACDDYNAFWQLYTQFPELPKIIQGREVDRDELPRIWSTKDGWKLWNSISKNIDDAYAMRLSQSTMLGHLTSVKNSLKDTANNTFAECLSHNILEIVKAKKDLSLHNIIICGSCAPIKEPDWLAKLKREITASTKETFTAQSIVLTSNTYNTIAKGASLYGTRKARGEPTYYDTIPKLSMLSTENNRQVWKLMTPDDIWEGGEKYFKEIPGFAINKNATSMDIYLEKELDQSVNNNNTIETTPYRKNIVDFGKKTAKEIPVTIDVSITPASGLANIAITPNDNSFRNGRSEVFNYDRMEKILENDLPKEKIGYPDTVKLSCYTGINILLYENIKNDCLALLNSKEILTQIQLQQQVNKSLRMYNSLNGKKEFCTDTYGNSEDKELNIMLNKISTRADQELECKVSSDDEMDNHTDNFVWFKTLIPQTLRHYIIEYFDFATGNNITNGKTNQAKYWQQYCKYCSRVISAKEDYSIFFNCIVTRIKKDTQIPFPMYAMDEIVRILMHKEDGWEGLTKGIAKTFVRAAIKEINNQFAQGNFQKKFLACAKLFLALLRFRKNDDSFLDPNEPQYKKLFEDISKILTQGAKEIARKEPNQRVKIEEVRDTIIDYMKHEGVPGLPQLLLEEEEEEE